MATLRVKDCKTLATIEALAGIGRPPVRRAAPRPLPSRPLEPPGTILAAFEVAGQPVPWRAPLSGKGKHHRTEPHVKAWKEHVARTAEAAGLGESAGVVPYQGPVEITVYPCRTAQAHRPGRRWAAKPDGDNLFKLIADAISGNVFKAPGKDPATGKRIISAHMPPSPIGRIIADDKFVTDIVIRKRYWSRALAWIEVRAVAPQDAGPFPFAP